MSTTPCKGCVHFIAQRMTKGPCRACLGGVGYGKFKARAPVSDLPPCPSGGDCTMGCSPTNKCAPPKLAVSTNPKAAQGMKKPPLHLVPASAVVEMSQAFADGAAKYGPFNWRIDAVDVTTYVAAADRHLKLYFNGQERTSDTNVKNLAAVMACCAILLDAEVSGKLIDNRPPAQDLEALMDLYTVGKGKPG